MEGALLRFIRLQARVYQLERTLPDLEANDRLAVLRELTVTSQEMLECGEQIVAKLQQENDNLQLAVEIIQNNH